MPSLLELKEVEKLIEKIASKHGGSTGRFEDYLHEGRVIAWEFILTHNVTKENFEIFSERLLEEISKAIKRQKGVDSFGSMKEASLDATFGPENEGTLKDLFASEEPTPLEHLLRLEIIEQKVEETPELLKTLAKRSLKEGTNESKQIVIYLLVKLMGIDEDLAPKKINYQTFVDFGLQEWLWVFFNNSPFRALNCAYPGKFLPHHMKRAPKKHWSGRGGRSRATKVLRSILEETGVEPEQYPKLITERFLEEFKITTPVLKLFKTHYGFLNAAYPGRYHPWELPSTTPHFFEKQEHVVKAVRWMVEEKLGYPVPHLTVKEIWRERIAMKITKETFSQYGLREIMATYHSPEPVLRMAYPDKFLDWSFQNKTKWKGEAGKKLAARAVRWFVEEYLELHPTSALLTWEMFIKNGLNGLITSRSLGFNSSVRAALLNAYPEYARNFED